MPNNVFPYPGNKARHSDWILEHIPEHECYVELFGGSGAILFNKPRSQIEVYNDLNGDIPHFFETLRKRFDGLQEWLRNTPYSREVYEEWSSEYYDGHRPDDDIERAGRFFFLRYAQFGGKVGQKAGYRISTVAQSGSPSKRLKNAPEKLRAFRDRLRGVNIECLDWKDAFEKYDKPTTVFYMDPPYMGTEGMYNSDGFDHYELYQAVSELEGRCLISYDSIPNFYGDGFTVTSKDSSFAIDGSGGNKDATEVLLMNVESDGESLMSDVGQQGLDALADYAPQRRRVGVDETNAIGT